ncbi:37S ribosomal protein [Mycena chlorophos]|uniref:37S ribosomal protein n=1 Tax=Mycena chlorophos TaxID=658473 RepID=A0A8H6THJ6_MYCCL|nr:37S ribosomal protein [Mycena chlorophos]
MTLDGDGPPARPVRPIPPQLPSSPEHVVILHGGYHKPLCRFNAFAVAEGSDHYGVPLVLVMEACYVLANNRPGHLVHSTTGTIVRDPGQRLRAMLAPGNYLLILENGDEFFSVLTTFDDFVSPQLLPPRWQAVCGRVPRMRIVNNRSTARKAPLQSAYLVPRSQGSARLPPNGSGWWDDSNHGVLVNCDIVDNISNCIALTADLNGPGLEQGHFVFAPYDGQLVLVFLTGELSEYAREHHLRAVQMPDRIHPHNIYARFAWTLFHLFEEALAKSLPLPPSLAPSMPITTSSQQSFDDWREMCFSISTSSHHEATTTGERDNPMVIDASLGFGDLLTTENMVLMYGEAGLSSRDEDVQDDFHVDPPDIRSWLAGVESADAADVTDLEYDHGLELQISRRPPKVTRLSEQQLEALQALELKLQRGEFAPRVRHLSSKDPSHPESLYAAYLDKWNQRAPSSGTAPITFEQFKQGLQNPLDDGQEIHDLTGEDGSPRSGLNEEPFAELLGQLDALEQDDPVAYRQRLDDITDDLDRQIAGLHKLSPEFQGRLDALEVKNTPAVEVARRVAQLVLSTKDRYELELVEDKLATYNGPLSVLNVAIEWYLKNPTEIDRAEPPEDEINAVPAHDNSAYYYHDTPFDELTRHIRKRDVQYTIKYQMHWKDREEIFRLIEVLVAPKFNEDLPTLQAIADIFNKYDHVHITYKTKPRLQRIRRLDVFRRLVPKPDVEAEEQRLKEEEEASIARSMERQTRQEEEREAEEAARRQQWPNLMTRDPLLDSREVLDFRPTKENPFHNRVVIRNHHSIFNEALEADGFDFDNPELVHTQTEDVEEINSNRDIAATLPISPTAKHLIVIPIKTGWATQQTPKGRKTRFVQWTIIGDGKGMVGLGMGKHEKADRAHGASMVDAIRNMDWVERFEHRTIWTEVRTKLGATKVILRPRPVGFGLRCNPNIHRLLTAAGIKDISAKVWGSRNPLGVLKATLRMLHAGHAPQKMGDGVGGPGRRMFKGTGLRNKTQIERERGRRLLDLRV